MSKKQKVSALDLSETILAMFSVYGQDVNEVIDDAMTEVARESVEDLKAVSRWSPKGHPTGEYSSDWVYEIVPVKRFSRKIVVHNETKYQLTHLLEFGHALRRGGRNYGSVKAYPHISPVNDKAQKHLEESIVRRIEQL